MTVTECLQSASKVRRPFLWTTLRQQATTEFQVLTLTLILSFL